MITSLPSSLKLKAKITQDHLSGTHIIEVVCHAIIFINFQALSSSNALWMLPISYQQIAGRVHCAELRIDSPPRKRGIKSETKCQPSLGTQAADTMSVVR